MALPVRDEVVSITIKGDSNRTPSMVTAWLPTPKELEALNAGAPVHVRILGAAHPPMMVTVGEEEANPGRCCLATADSPAALASPI